MHHFLPVHIEPCGSGLARESGGSVTRNVECKTAFASKLAPTMSALWRRFEVGVVIMLFGLREETLRGAI
jgi:hypothetical protein